MPFITTYNILKAWRDYEDWSIIVYGPRRRGKSSFCIQLLAELYGIIRHPDWKRALDLPYSDEYDPNAEYTWKEWARRYPTPDWNAWRDWMKFLPEEWLDLIDRAQATGRQQLCCVWDDAGLFASKYEYHKAFAIEISKYWNVGSTDFASFVFTTPDPRWLLKNIRDLPGGHTGSVAKTTGNRYQRTLRRVRIYNSWMSPDMVKGGVRSSFDDMFDVTLPNVVFREYDKMRRGYAQISKRRLRDIVSQMKEKRAEQFKMEVFTKTGINVDAPDDDGEKVVQR
ncbi:MAG: hypothetical protein ACXADB_13915 [Candidatus Hermodarchaeia archaeon]|jgi:hypothetical protein